MGRFWATILGWHGAGKTTVGQTLEAAPHPGLDPVAYLSGSRLLELYILEEREGWQAVKEAKDRGETADPALTHKLLREHIGGLPEDVTVILDGFPKSRGEVGLTRATLPSPGIELAVLLDCDRLARTARIRGRLVCSSCGVVTSSFPGCEAGSACPRNGCGGLLRRRPDDDPAVHAFRDNGEPPTLLAEEFAQEGRLTKIDATAGVDEVVAEVAAALSRQRGQVSAQSRSSREFPFA